MKNQILTNNLGHIHFVGIGGVSLSALAEYCIGAGFSVSGSDICENNYTLRLSALGAKIYYKHSKSNVKDADKVVITSAVSLSNPEVKQAVNLKIPVYKRSEFLGAIFLEHENRIAVSGSHGKTTTTSMISNIFYDHLFDPTCFIGGFDKRLSNFRRGKKDFMITEACEYKENFLDLSPTVSVILNIDNDHLDYYKNMDNLVNAFITFSKNSLNVVNFDDDNCYKHFNNQNVISFGIRKKAYITAKNIRESKSGVSFLVAKEDVVMGRIKLKLKGKHNVYNALASIAVAEIFNIQFLDYKKSLENFNGVSRRNEFIGKAFNKDFYCDYAHHPKEIETILGGEDKNTLIIFQPHTYSRTEILMNDFIRVLKNCKNLVIYKTYPAREKYNKKGSGLTLYKNLERENVEDKRLEYCITRKELEKIIKLNCVSNKVLFLGAGDIYDIAKKIVNANKK